MAYTLDKTLEQAREDLQSALRVYAGQVAGIMSKQAEHYLDKGDDGSRLWINHASLEEDLESEIMQLEWAYPDLNRAMNAADVYGIVSAARFTLSWIDSKLEEMAE